MTSFTTTHRVRHSARDMFDLVVDMEKYPRFLPLCEALRIRGRQDLGDGREVVIAAMTVAYGPVRETFTTRDVIDPAALRIDITYLDGPFEHLDNHWVFREVEGGGCDIDFFIDYRFKSRVLGALMGAMFDRAFRKFSEAFEKRADEVYGRKG